jgi:hypothetical protein
MELRESNLLAQPNKTLEYRPLNFLSPKEQKDFLPIENWSVQKPFGLVRGRGKKYPAPYLAQ